MSTRALVLTVNGKADQAAAGQTIADLLDAHGLRSEWVVIEHNGEALPRDRFSEIELCDGDRLEVVRAVAGGAG